MKADKIDAFTTGMAHCDWIIMQAKEIKALLAYRSDSMVELNKVRALSAIDTSLASLHELKLFIEGMVDKK